MATVRRVWLPLLGVAIASAVLLALKGFTVDDALISARYAFHIAQGHGHGFQVGGPETDGVTPLWWPYLLAPFAEESVLAGLEAGRVIGTIAWLGAAAMLAVHLRSIVEEVPTRRAWIGLFGAAVAFATPAVGAWATSGMETGMATGLTTIAAVLGANPRYRVAAAGALGLAASLRPELVPFSLTLALGCAWSDAPGDEATSVPARARALIAYGTLALLPFLAVTIVRTVWFGSAAPLALRAKPSDLWHGIIYVLASIVMTGPPLAVVAPRTWKRLPAWPRWLLAGFVVHAAAIVVAGGDWMFLSRLFVPLLPALAIVFVHTARHAPVWSTVVRGAACVAVQVYVLVAAGAASARVFDDRTRLIRALEERVGAEDVVATVDIGWVGAAHGGRVVDLAGVTDPEVAALAGGHTSKRLPEGFFDTRGVTHLVLLRPAAAGEAPWVRSWERCQFARTVETRLCRRTRVREEFVPEAEIRSTARLSYVLLRRASAMRGGEPSKTW